MPGLRISNIHRGRYRIAVPVTVDRGGDRRRTRRPRRHIPSPRAYLFAGALAVCFVGYLAATVPAGGSRARRPRPGPPPTFRSPADSAPSRTCARGDRGRRLRHCSRRSRNRFPVERLSRDRLERDEPGEANLRLLWRTDYAPGKLNSTPITVIGPAAAGDTCWGSELGRSRPRRRPPRPGPAP